jgi:glycosyltransferase involved in cell wall biosynthesis
MNVLFLTLIAIRDIGEHGIYTDLMRCFVEAGHQVTILSADEGGAGAGPVSSGGPGAGARVIRVGTGAVQKTGLLKKGLATITLEKKYIDAIKRHCGDVRFDLVLYSTPPITFGKAVGFVKKRDGAKSYLLLKDIFPQNAVDLGMMEKGGILYRYFRKKEERLYMLSDWIGCMSQANADYVVRHDPWIDASKVHVNPNSITPGPAGADPGERARLRGKYGIPLDARAFIYGGNLGKPQDVPFVIECLRTQVGKAGRHFVVCGNGTEYPLLEHFFESARLGNMTLIGGLPKEAFDPLVRACDVGLIFLDHRFTIPNYPSRLLSYMEASLPVLACTDTSTDIGKTVVDGGFGWWCESDDPGKAADLIDEVCGMRADELPGKQAYQYLLQHFTAQQSYDRILASIREC